MKTVADQIIATLVAHGVDTIYCLPGEETIELLDSAAEAGMELFVARHEQHAAFMAAAHGRLTGSPGVLVTTLGPGATNALTGIAQADLCRFPLLMLCGQKPLRNSEEGSFQVLDLVAIAKPVTRFAVALSDPETAPEKVEAAIAATMSDHPGPALVVIPEDIAATERPEFRPVVSTSRHPVAPDETLQLISHRLTEAKSPVLLAGSGAQDPETAAALQRFSEATGIGVLATQMGKGALAEDHALSLRALGQNSPDTASISILSADLVLTVGYHPTEHPPESWHPDESFPIIHIDSSPPKIEANYRPAVIAVGHPATTLERLAGLPAGDHRERSTGLRSAIVSALEAEDRPPSFPPTAYDVAVAMRAELDRLDIVALDNGVYKLWFARHYPALAPNTLLLDNALATMGAGLATAMVAARLNPDQRVVAVCGDGGFLMNSQDLVGCRNLNNLTIVILRDDSYGFIAWHQQEQGVDETAVDLTNPNFSMLAESFGISAIEVTENNSIQQALQEANRTEGPVLIDCPLDQSRNSELGAERYEFAKRLLDDH